MSRRVATNNTNLVEFDLPQDLKWVITSDPEFNNALDYILHTSYSLFINGPAGTGKTVLIKLAYRLLSGNTMVLGSTGVASSNLADSGVPCATIHSGLIIRPQDIFPRKFNSKDKNDVKGRNLLCNVDTLLIEEVGMVSASLFDHLGILIEKANKKRERPIRVICFGDVLQLPPVVKDKPDVIDFYDHYFNGGIFFFNAPFFKSYHFVTVFLNTIYRQAEGSFQNILNRLRTNRAIPSDFEVLRSRVMPIEEFRANHKVGLLLAPTVSAVRELNYRYGVPKRNPIKQVYKATISGHFDWNDSGLVEKEHVLYEGQQVMCIYNDPQHTFQNGTLCIVKSLGKDYVVAEKANGTIIFIGLHRWSQYKYVVNTASGEVYAEESGAVVQMGCKPATASTIHKAQGLTLDSVYLYLEGKWVPPSGVYLGLSRCKTLEGVGISRPVTPYDIHVLQEPVRFMQGD